MQNPQISRYSKVAILFHWVIAILVLGNFFLGQVGHKMPRDIRADYMEPHMAIGISILILSLMRLFWRIGHKPPALPTDIKKWVAKLAKTVHILFYIVLIAIPLSGLIMVTAYPGASGVSYFGLFTIDLPITQSKALSGAAHEAHEILAQIMILAFILHIVGAMKHQFGAKIPLIQRMWP